MTRFKEDPSGSLVEWLNLKCRFYGRKLYTDGDRYQNMSQPRILTIQITMEERVERKVVLEGIAHHGSWNRYFMCNDEEDLEYTSLRKCSVVYILVHMLQTSRLILV